MVCEVYPFRNVVIKHLTKRQKPYSNWDSERLMYRIVNYNMIEETDWLVRVKRTLVNTGRADLVSI